MLLCCSAHFVICGICCETWRSTSSYLDQIIFHIFRCKAKSLGKNCIPPKTISSCADFLKVFFNCWGPPSQRYEDVFGSLCAALQNEEETKIVETIEETPYSPIKNQLLKRDIDDGFSYGSPEEQLSPCEDLEIQNYEEDLEEEQLDDWIEALHERKRVIDDLFLEFQRNPSHDLGVEISNKIEENNVILNLIEERIYGYNSTI